MFKREGSGTAGGVMGKIILSMPYCLYTFTTFFFTRDSERNNQIEFEQFLEESTNLTLLMGVLLWAALILFVLGKIS